MIPANLPLVALGCVVAILPLAACDRAGTGSAGPGDAARGRTVFESGTCPSCHTLSSVSIAKGTTGPVLDGLGSRAATRKSGIDAEAYIRESEQNPDAFVVEGFSRGVMPAFPGSAQQLNDLVAFLLTQ